MWSFYVCSIVTLILGDGALSQVFGYEMTSFSCQGRSPGYYADLETECRTYHVCDGNSHFTYICPARTLFRQRSKICEHAYLVRCGDEEIYLEDEDGISRLSVGPEDRAHTEDIEHIRTRAQEFFTTDTPEPAEITTTQTTSSTTKRLTTVAIQPSDLHRGNATSVDYSSQTNKIVKFVIKDIRSLFYIPELDNNSITIQSEREFVLPVDRKNLLRFRNREKARHAFSACPSYCDPKFFFPGTCHPCIMIK